MSDDSPTPPKRATRRPGKALTVAAAVMAALALLLILTLGPIESDQARLLRAQRGQSGNPNLSPAATTPLTIAIPPYTDPGELLFTGKGACSTCHSLAGLSTASMGPPLDDIATQAARRVEGMSAPEYIRQSITSPSAYTAGVKDGRTRDYPPQLMAAAMQHVSLTPEQVEQIVAFLMTKQ